MISAKDTALLEGSVGKCEYNRLQRSLLKYEKSGLRGGGYEDDSPLECDAVWSGRYVPALQRNHYIDSGNRFL